MIDQAYQDFIRFIDSLFFDGYAQGLAKEHPDHFKTEFNQFINNYYGNNNSNKQQTNQRRAQRAA